MTIIHLQSYISVSNANCSFLYDSDKTGLSNTIIPNLQSDAYVKHASCLDDVDDAFRNEICLQ